jgi:hypothetical protein
MDYMDNGTPLFDGKNYERWSSRMKIVLEEHGYDVWYSVFTGYTASKKPLKVVAKKELQRNKKIAMDVILDGLLDLMKFKVGKFSSAKELWDKIHTIYSKGSLLVIIELEHADHNKEYVEIHQEERSSSCQTNLEEEIGNGMENHDKEYYEEGEVDLEAELIHYLSELKRERREKNPSRKNCSS